jgi:hypothetical protein
MFACTQQYAPARGDVNISRVTAADHLAYPNAQLMHESDGRLSGCRMNCPGITAQLFRRLFGANAAEVVFKNKVRMPYGNKWHILVIDVSEGTFHLTWSMVRPA